MGILDDAASMVSGRTSHSKHHHHRSKSLHHKSSRDKSRSRSRSRTRGAPSIVGSMFGLGSEAGHRHSHSHSHRDKEKRHSSSRSFFEGGSIFGGDDGHRHSHSHHHSRHDSSRRGSGFFGLGNGGNTSRGSFFGFGGGRSPSYYKRSPRQGFLQKIWRQLKRLVRDLVYYAKKHPWKVFMLVIVPLVTTGALTALLARFGLRLPNGLERMIGIAAKAGAGDGVGLVGEAIKMASGGLGGGYNHSEAHVERGRDGGMSWESRSWERDNYGGGGGGSWADGLMESVGKGLMGNMGGGLMSSVGKMFY